MRIIPQEDEWLTERLISDLWRRLQSLAALEGSSALPGIRASCKAAFYLPYIPYQALNQMKIQFFVERKENKEETKVHLLGLYTVLWARFGSQNASL